MTERLLAPQQDGGRAASENDRPAEPPALDIEALVGELRVEAEELRRRLGPSALPPAESRSQALAEAKAGDAGALSASGGAMAGAAAISGIGLAAVRTGHLAAVADPNDAEIHSHRARLGRAVVLVKRLLKQLLTPVLDRQAAFNRAALESLTALEREAGAQLATLARRQLEIEARVDALAALEAPADDGFDYRAFEEAFRGSAEHVRSAQAQYLRFFPDAAAGPIVDLGCGRAEFLSLLRDAGVAAFGIERDQELVERACRSGLDVRRGDVLWGLESAADGSLGGVVSFQVVEHLPFWKTVRLVGLAHKKLRAGGCLIVETVNLQTVVPWTRAWSLDPSHRQPVHPLTLKFVAERAGFARVELVYSGPVEAAKRLEEGEDEDRETRNARRLNELLFAPQDYALVAWT